jgi:hypothetical protein
MPLNTTPRPPNTSTTSGSTSVAVDITAPELDFSKFNIAVQDFSKFEVANYWTELCKSAETFAFESLLEKLSSLQVCSFLFLKNHILIDVFTIFIRLGFNPLCPRLRLQYLGCPMMCWTFSSITLQTGMWLCEWL